MWWENQRAGESAFPSKPLPCGFKVYAYLSLTCGIKPYQVSKKPNCKQAERERRSPSPKWASTKALDKDHGYRDIDYSDYGNIVYVQ